MPTHLRAPLAIAAVLAVAGAGYLALVRVVFGGLGPGPMARCAGHERFERARWRDSAQAYGPLAVRGCMVDDLRERHRLRGRTRADVVALLGEPRPTSYFREYDLVYWLGPERSPISVDSEWLALRLDSTGRVTEERLVTD